MSSWMVTAITPEGPVNKNKPGAFLKLSWFMDSSKEDYPQSEWKKSCRNKIVTTFSSQNCQVDLTLYISVICKCHIENRRKCSSYQCGS